jgi:hypothetical protein
MPQATLLTLDVGLASQDGRSAGGDKLSPDYAEGEKRLRTGILLEAGSAGASSETWLGNIDDVRVYHRALSAGDVTQLFAFTGVAAANFFPRRRN